MANKKFWLGIPVMALVFGMTVVGCASLFSGRAPKSFQSGAGGETTILLREGIEFNQAFREVTFILNRHGFDPEMMQTEVGYIRTRWIYSWNDTGKTSEDYRVRIVCNFNPSRTQLILNAEAEILKGDNWIKGFDTRAIETLRTDITQSIGN